MERRLRSNQEIVESLVAMFSWSRVRPCLRSLLVLYRWRLG